eukprot:7247502-Prymnesium_polylepis.1
MLLTIEEEWVPAMAAKSFVEDYPRSLIPATSDCWQILSTANSDSSMMRAVARAMPEAAAALGINISNKALPAGVMAPMPATSAGRPSSPGRSASPGRSRSPVRSSHDNLLDGGGRGAGGAHRSGGRHRLPHKRVYWKNDTDFSYSRNGQVIVPYRAARDLGVRVSDFDWAVVASTKPDHERREQFCSTPDHPGCISGHRHYQSKEFADYFHRLASSGSRQ